MRPLVCLTACVAIGCGGTSSIDNGPSTTSSATLYGRVWLTRIPAQGSTQFSAQFGGAAPANVEHEQAFGSCYSQPYPSSPATTEFDSAGTLSLLGTTTPWQVQPGSNMSYSSTRTADEWSEGAQLEIRATGAQAPAFDTTVIAPPTLRFLNDRAALVEAVTGNADVTLQWMPVDADQVWIGVESGDKQVTCSWTGATGRGTIPGAALATLPQSGRTIRSPVALNSHAFQSNAWSINVIAQARSEFPDGSSL
ncbi:MAG TPA: hypothetical protein VF765_04950 [Polyangiaceae bacterium]